jgi:hypothetical protein
VKLYVVEGKFQVPGAKWLPWSEAHTFGTQQKAEMSMRFLDHGQHPVPCKFRVREYGPIVAARAAGKPK